MQYTKGDRITDEYLKSLETTANMHKSSWTMGVHSHAMAALIKELRELREKVNQ